jgi:hypothetical protein
VQSDAPDVDTYLTSVPEARKAALTELCDHRHRLTGLNVGKGCIRDRRPDQIDVAVVDDMLRAIEASTGPVC